jgi:hypothetical protein
MMKSSSTISTRIIYLWQGVVSKARSYNPTKTAELEVPAHGRISSETILSPSISKI